MQKESLFNKGVYFALLTAIISGFANFFSSFAVKIVKDPFVFTAAKNIAVALILCSILVIFRKLDKFKNISAKNWAYLILIGIIGGSIPFLLFFKGLSMSSAVVGAFIHKSLFIWVSILAVIFLKEKIGRLQLVAFGILIAGNFLLGAFNNFSFTRGEAMIFAATLFWSVEYVIAKKVLKDIAPDVLIWARMFFGSIIILAYLAVIGKAGMLLTFNPQQIFWTALVSVFLLAYVTFWYRALKLAPATVVSSVLVLGSPITTILSIIFISGFKYNNLQLAGIVLAVIGVFVLLVSKSKEKEQRTINDAV